MTAPLVKVGPVETVRPGRKLVRGSLAGDFGTNETPILAGWIDGMAAAIQEASHGPLTVVVLVDLCAFGTYTVTDGITLIANVFRDKGSLIYRVATVGGTLVHEIAELSITSMSHMEVRNFKDETAAVAWLSE